MILKVNYEILKCKNLTFSYNYKITYLLYASELYIRFIEIFQVFSVLSLILTTLHELSTIPLSISQIRKLRLRDTK